MEWSRCGHERYRFAVASRRVAYMCPLSRRFAGRSRLASNLITEVGNETPDLEAFKQAIVGIKAGNLVRVKVRTLSGNEARHGFYHDVSLLARAGVCAPRSRMVS